ncbi:MAG: Gfo/Idh/MocA family oxidoreductase [Planctomycetota bacterium]|nr:Gfo/Idh/MocA family oxidoreductase [Planctomycetota bacterium]
MINVGITGLGFMGMIHYLAYGRKRGISVKAICETDPVRLAGDWRSIKGNFGPQGKKMDLAGIAKYSAFDELLDDPTIDLVDICLPPSQHADAVVAALKAGKHVFCEKPIAMKSTDAQRMVRTAKQTGKMLSIGHVLPFFPEYRFAYRTVASGKYGKVIGCSFKRMISDPLWMGHFYDPDVCGGPMLDLHIHDAHFIRLICGMPKAVQTIGRMRGEVLEIFNSQFIYDGGSTTDGPMVTATCGALMQQGRPFTHAFEIYLEKATLLFDFATIGKNPTLAIPLTVMTNNGRVTQPKLGSGDPIDAFAEEIGEVIKSIRTETPSDLLDGQLARDALILCHKQTQSAARGRTVKV